MGGIGVRLAADDLDLDSTQQLLTFLEGQSDLRGGQVGDWPSNRTDVVYVIGGLPSGVSSKRIVHFIGWPSNANKWIILPLRPHLRSTPTIC